ncbi:hypothetical protein Tco_0815074 [Tanacetum coccineum]
MVAKRDQKTAAEEGGKKMSATKADKSKKPATAKQLKPKPAKEKSSKPAPALKPKVTKEKPSKPSPVKHPKRGKVKKLRKGKSPFQLIDEDEPTQPEPKSEHQAHVDGMAIREPVAEATRPLYVVEGKGKAIATQEQIGEEQSKDVANMVNLEEKTAEINKGQAGSDPGKTPEFRPLPDDDKMDEDQAGPDPRECRVALAGPNPEPTHKEFMADVYHNVYESLKFPADKHVILEDPLSSSRTLSLMKNLDDAYTIGDQFLNEKSTEDEPGTLNVEAEVVSLVTVPIHQASSLVPPLSTPVIDLSPPKPIPSTTQAPIFTATTTTTTTTLLLPPPP